MRKFYFKKTGRELHLGDQIELEFTEEKDGKLTLHHFECKFIPELIDMLVEHDIIRVEGEKEKGESKYPFPQTTGEKCDFLMEVCQELEERISKLEKKVMRLQRK